MCLSRPSISVRSVSALAKCLKWLKEHLPTQRRLIQLYSFLLYNAHIKGFITGEIYTGNAKFLCVPGFNCYSCPGAIGACPLGALQNALASSGSRTPTYILGILMLFGITLGRTICGWLCPAGLFQELLYRIPTPKLKKNRITRVLCFLKYAILAFFVIYIPLTSIASGIPVPAFCKYICPVGTGEGAISLLAHPENADNFSMLGILFTNKMILFILILTVCIFVFRAFCRFLCPLGAIYGLFSKVAIIGVKVDAPSCVNCGKCIRTCKMDVMRVGDHECIHCGECIAKCPTGAIRLKAGRITLCPNEKKAEPTKPRLRTAAWILAILVLAGCLWFFNRPETTIAEPTAPIKNTIPQGHEVGMQAPDFTVPIFGGEEFTLSHHRGKTVVVNFWATWCGPCVKELPYFDTLSRTYPEDIVVIAIHSELVTDNVEAFLANYDYSLPFALDEAGEAAKSLGVSTMLPHTVVISPSGIITYNAAGSLTYEDLTALIEVSAQ